jgi:hypothetical protein
MVRRGHLNMAAIGAAPDSHVVANSLVFLSIGMCEARQDFIAIRLPAVMVIGLVTAGRAVAIYPCCFLFSRSSLHATMKHQHALFRGGLRGALALALGLSPEVTQRVSAGWAKSPDRQGEKVVTQMAGGSNQGTITAEPADDSVLTPRRA